MSNKENDKYFIPNIEDFRIGYECEVNWNAAYEDDFIPIKLKICDDLEDGTRDCYCSNVDEVLIAYDDGYAKFRTPYLTKEQIENEGWKTERNTSLDDVLFYAQMGNLFKLIYTYSTKILDIWTNDENDKLINLFRGECKSINEFRYIMKLLKIK